MKAADGLQAADVTGVRVEEGTWKAAIRKAATRKAAIRKLAIRKAAIKGPGREGARPLHQVGEPHHHHLRDKNGNCSAKHTRGREDRPSSFFMLQKIRSTNT